ncbi:MAG TPA: plastocyanin/azurin family copper-binding protein [Gemmatimonadales bacterium]|jgi:plastocyanin
MLAVGGAIGACGGSTPTAPSSSGGNGNNVQALASLAFSPSVITIQPNQSVTFVFGSVGHTVTFDAVNGAPDNIATVNSPDANVSVSRTFTTAGTYTYHCSVHTFMTGTVVVGSNSVTPPPAPPPPPPGDPYGRRVP